MGDKISEWPPLHSLWPPVYNWISHPSSIIRRNFLKKCGKFNEKLKIAMDGDMWFKIFDKHAKMDLIPIVISNFKSDGVSQNQKKLAREVLFVIYNNFGIIIKRWVANIFLVIKAIFENLFIVLK
jgi:hypothetical protein